MNARPLTLREIAERSDSLAEFGRHFQDWLHVIRSFSSRPQVENSLRSSPPRLEKKFKDGAVADAWLAAYAEYVAEKIGRAIPHWAKGRVSPEPWFAVGTGTRERIEALRDSPAPFKARNVYTPSVDLPLRLNAGRPSKPAEELRRANAERQRRFRERRKAEFSELRRRLASKQA
jgi:hypothetical protein